MPSPSANTRCTAGAQACSSRAPMHCGKPTHSFLTSDDRALGTVCVGLQPDIVHLCVSYVQDWVDLGYAQPWDTSLLTSRSLRA